jgi:hypothetical protein
MRYDGGFGREWSAGLPDQSGSAFQFSSARGLPGLMLPWKAKTSWYPV